MRRSKPRVLALTLGENGFASSRVRAAAALATMRQDGLRTTRVSASSWMWPLRFMAALLILRPTTTIVQKVALPGWYAKLVAALSKRLVFECDDAIQLGYNLDPAIARTVSRNLRTLLPRCDRVIVSNSLLREDFCALGARDAAVFPGPAPALAVSPEATRKGVLWLGSPSTIDNARTIVYPAIELLNQGVELIAVGAEHDRRAGRVTEWVWSESRQTCCLALARVGVAPQQQDEWNRRKAFYKVLEYLAANVIPVVPAQPAVQTLLGAELDVVAVTAVDDHPSTWASAISVALESQVDANWLDARDRIFARWSAQQLGRLMLG